MTKTATSQPQHEIDPMETWTRMAQETIGRMQAFYDELAAWEGKAYGRAKQVSDQFAVLATDTMTYLSDLAAEWRKVTLEATRRSADVFRARA